MTRSGVNYAWDADGRSGMVCATTDPVDGDAVFATFTEARATLVKWLNGIADEYKEAAREARALRKKDADAGFAPDHDAATVAGEGPRK